MQTTQKQKASLGAQIVRGFSAGCSFVVLVQLYYWLAFHPRRTAENDKLYEATNEVLFVSGFILLIASLALSGSRPKLAACGIIIALITILAGFFSPLRYVRA
jgi:hypothetical protein